MGNEVSLNITGIDGIKSQVFTNFKVTDKSLLNTIFPEMENNTLTTEQLKKLEEIAARSGGSDVLELSDLTTEERLEHFNFNEYYSIRVDGDNYIVKIKKTPFYVKDPSAETIKKDFGLEDNVLYDPEDPYLSPNKELFERRPVNTSENYINYNSTKFEAGDELVIPKNKVNITSSPCGFWGRLCQYD